MKNAIENLKEAQAKGLAGRPKVNGFPYLAETLRRAGVRRNEWILPACESLYVTDLGSVVSQGAPLISGDAPVPNFDETALLRIIDADKAGQTSFPEFLLGSWKAGVVRYEVDFEARTVIYFGATQERYVEHYPQATI